MTIAEWIIMVILAVTLFVFLVIAIVLAVKMMKFLKEANKIVATGQDIALKADSIAGKADDVAENIKGFTSAGKLVKTLVDQVSGASENNTKIIKEEKKDGK